MTGKRFARLAAAVAVCLLVIAAFVVQLLGGRGSVPGWQQLRAALGVPLQTEGSAPQTADSSTVVYVLDVGQGDAVLLCQDGAYCLIDTGPVEAEDALLYDLDVLGVPSLNYLVLTIPTADHTGNAARCCAPSRSKTLLLPLWQPRQRRLPTGAPSRRAGADSGVLPGAAASVYEGIIVRDSAGFTFCKKRTYCPKRRYSKPDRDQMDVR